MLDVRATGYVGEVAVKRIQIQIAEGTMEVEGRDGGFWPLRDRSGASGRVSGRKDKTRTSMERFAEGTLTVDVQCLTVDGRWNTNFVPEKDCRQG